MAARGRLGRRPVAAWHRRSACSIPQSYSSGQNVSRAFEGWEQNADGSFNFLFGYMNRNWQEEIDVPVGSDNGIEPGGLDPGQPAVGCSGRHTTRLAHMSCGTWQTPAPC